MKEIVKKILSVVVLLTALISMCVVSVAATDFDDDQNLETDLDYSEDTTYSMLRGNNLNFGTTSVKKMASNKVAVSGITQCHHACDKVYLTLTLERKVNGTYTEYKTWTYSESNVTHINKGFNVIVPSGYYYRVRGYHAAKDGSKESVNTVTKGVLVK